MSDISIDTEKFKYVSDSKVIFLEYHILKLIATSAYIDEIDAKLTKLYKEKYTKSSLETVNGLSSYYIIKGIVQDLVFKGFKLTHDGFPVPATWEAEYGEALSVDDWIRDTDVLSLIQ